jgi:poly(3-hydroxybutyrate) depolymerase
MRRIALSVAFLSFTLLLSAAAFANEATTTEIYAGRKMFVYVPQNLPPRTQRALVIVLHGGLGNAERIASQRSESGLNMNAMADQGGFIVAYLNGTAVARLLGSSKEGWNAGGGCCGLPAQRNVDDVGYITAAAEHLAEEYGIDRKRIFGIGHSNGAIMAQRMICVSDLFAAAVAVSGPLNLPAVTCPAAKGKRVLAIHGADDENVPIKGGEGAKGLSHVNFASEAQSKEIMTASGATYDLDIVKGAQHMLSGIDSELKAAEGQTIAEKAARYFGLIAAE